MIRIFLSSDHPFVRLGIRRILSSGVDLEIIGEAKSVLETLQKCALMQPHILLMDVKNPDIALDVNKEMKVLCPQVAMIILAAFDNSVCAHNLLNAGVKGYLLAEEAFIDILDAIYMVSNGGIWISSSTLRMRNVNLQNQKQSQIVPTQREFDVIQLLSNGLNNIEMARRLCISERTVRFHLGNLMLKLKATNRTEAVIKAIRIG